MTVRPAAVAGQFYPADPAALAAWVNTLMPAVPPDGRRPRAVIAPHAGYQYSGAVAGAAYARLAACRGALRRVVVLGPAHYVRLTGMAVPQADTFATPLGPVPVDLDARQTALDLPAVVVTDRPHTPNTPSRRSCRFCCTPSVPRPPCCPCSSAPPRPGRSPSC